MNSNLGRHGARWRKIRAEVYARNGPCCRCGQFIDYTLPYLDPYTGKPDPRSKSVDHFPFPLIQRPDLAEELTNLAAAHLGCNWDAGTNRPKPHGITSRSW